MIYELEQYKNQPIDIIIVAGQSNAFGHGIGSLDQPYQPNENILCMTDEQSIHYENDPYGKEYLKVDLNTNYHIDILKETDTDQGKKASLAYYFAQEYGKKSLQTGRKVLLVFSPVGGTGFIKKQWTPDGVLFQRMIQMTDLALSMNQENKIVALLWHQGECDAWENREQTIEYTETAYYNHFSLFMKLVRERYGNMPMICGGFCYSWVKDFVGHCNAVYNATKQIISEIGNASFVESTGLKSNMEDHECDDNIHFCRSSCKEFGERYYKAYQSLKN